jgi:hypothetical protein
MASEATFLILGEFNVFRDVDQSHRRLERRVRHHISQWYSALARERLCEMLWKFYDPRGALRWSLSEDPAIVDAGSKSRAPTAISSPWIGPVRLRLPPSQG